MRTGLASLAAFFAIVSVAQADPTLTVSAGAESSGTAMGGLFEHNRVTGIGRGVQPMLTGLPALIAPAGTQVTATLSQPADELTAGLGGRTPTPTPATVTRISDRAFALTMPTGYALPADLWMSVKYSVGDVTGEASYGVKISPAAPSAANLRLRGSRLDVDVICPVGCTGFLTLKTANLRVARFEVTEQGTLTAKVPAAARRHITRHKLKELRAVLTTTGRAPHASALKIGN